jgi:hypothetical protein
VARAERGRVTRRVRGICEILGNTLAARRQNEKSFSRRARESAESGQDAFRNQHQADRAEARSTRALEATVRSMRELVDRLERCEGEVRYDPALASRRTTEAPSLGAEDDEASPRSKKPAPAFSLDAVTTRFTEASKRESSFRVSVEPEPEPSSPLAVSARSPRRVREKKTFDEDVSRRRRPLASSGNGFGRRENEKSPFATTRQRGKENGSRLDSRADPDPFWFASRGFGLRDRFASSPIMSPRYVR